MLQVIMDCTMPILLIPMELHYQLELIGRALLNHYKSAEKRILVNLSKFWHIFIIKVSKNYDLPSRNEILLTNQFSILEN